SRQLDHASGSRRGARERFSRSCNSAGHLPGSPNGHHLFRAHPVGSSRKGKHVESSVIFKYLLQLLTAGVVQMPVQNMKIWKSCTTGCEQYQLLGVLLATSQAECRGFDSLRVCRASRAASAASHFRIAAAARRLWFTCSTTLR